MIEIPEGYVIVRAIVRCKDCKYWHGHREYERPMLCHRWQDITLPTLADDFCSRGVKR